MANVKISQLPAVTQSKASDLLAIVSSGVTSQITQTNFAASLTAATASYVNPLTQSLTINGFVGINQPNPQYSLDVSGSIRLSQALLLPTQKPLPVAATGSLATSGSNLYFYNGTGSNGGWTKVV